MHVFGIYTLYQYLLVKKIAIEFNKNIWKGEDFVQRVLFNDLTKKKVLFNESIKINKVVVIENEKRKRLGSVGEERILSV